MVLSILSNQIVCFFKIKRKAAPRDMDPAELSITKPRRIMLVIFGNYATSTASKSGTFNMLVVMLIMLVIHGMHSESNREMAESQIQHLPSKPSRAKVITRG